MNNDFNYGVSLHLYKTSFSQSSNNIHSSRMLMSCSSPKTGNPLFNWILKVNEWQLSPGKVTKQTNLFSTLSESTHTSTWLTRSTCNLMPWKNNGKRYVNWGLNILPLKGREKEEKNENFDKSSVYSYTISRTSAYPSTYKTT